MHIIKYTIEVEVPSDVDKEGVAGYALDLLNAITDLTPTLALAKIAYEEKDDG